MDATEWVIRRGTGEDVVALVEVGARTFADTYGQANEPEDLAAYVGESYNDQVVSAALADPQVTYLVAEAGGRVVGFAKLVADRSEVGIEADRPAELNQLYVEQDQKGRGIGTALLAACVDRARSAGHDVLWLGVWEGNPAAIAFYERSGLRRVGTHRFQLGSQRQTDLLMAMPLSSSSRCPGCPAG